MAPPNMVPIPGIIEPMAAPARPPTPDPTVPIVGFFAPSNEFNNDPAPKPRPAPPSRLPTVRLAGPRPDPTAAASNASRPAPAGVSAAALASADALPSISGVPRKPVIPLNMPLPPPDRPSDDSIPLGPVISSVSPILERPSASVILPRLDMLLRPPRTLNPLPPALARLPIPVDPDRLPALLPPPPRTASAAPSVGLLPPVIESESD